MNATLGALLLAAPAVALLLLVAAGALAVGELPAELLAELQAAAASVATATTAAVAPDLSETFMWRAPSCRSIFYFCYLCVYLVKLEDRARAIRGGRSCRARHPR
jgi:hypothetical protein